jgi:hypothetical protein
MADRNPDLIDIGIPLDVWLRFRTDEDRDGIESEVAEYEANVYLTEEYHFDVQWYHNDVGVVSHELFNTYAEAQSWLEGHGYQDFTS